MLIMHVLDTHHRGSLHALLIRIIIVTFGTVPRHSGAEAKKAYIVNMNKAYCLLFFWFVFAFLSFPTWYVVDS